MPSPAGSFQRRKHSIVKDAVGQTCYASRKGGSSPVAVVRPLVTRSNFDIAPRQLFQPTLRRFTFAKRARNCLHQTHPCATGHRLLYASICQARYARASTSTLVNILGDNCVAFRLVKLLDAFLKRGLMFHDC